MSEIADILNAISAFITTHGMGLTFTIIWFLLVIGLIVVIVRYLFAQVNNTDKEHKKIQSNIEDVKDFIAKQSNIKTIENSVIAAITYNADKIVAHIDSVYTDQLESSYHTIMEHIDRLDTELTNVAERLRTLLDQAQFGRAEDTKQLSSTLEAIRRDLTSLAASIRTTINILIDKKVGDE